MQLGRRVQCHGVNTASFLDAINRNLRHVFHAPGIDREYEFVQQSLKIITTIHRRDIGAIGRRRLKTELPGLHGGPIQ